MGGGFVRLTHAGIAVGNTTAYCKLGNGTVRNLCQDTIYVHPSTKQCSWTPSVSVGRTIFSKSGTVTTSGMVTTVGTANLLGYALILIYYNGKVTESGRVGINLRINDSAMFSYVSSVLWNYAELGVLSNSDINNHIFGVVYTKSAAITSNSTIAIDTNTDNSITLSYSILIKGIKL